jgi:D-hexose-6-phosphate mutarotase
MASPPAAEQLEARFGLPGTVRFEAGEGGLVRAVVTTPRATAHVYLHGGHVTHYHPRGQGPVLFLSARSAFAPGQAIRGGVPVVFPWFGARAGDPGAPAHGFARTAAWDVEAVTPAPDGSVAVLLRLDASETTRVLWPHGFVVRYRVGIGAALDLALGVQNTSTEAFRFEAALHTYLAVGDVREVSVRGLEATPYIDKVDGMRRKVEGRAAVRLGGETDRVYLGTRAGCIVDDPAGGRRLIVDKRGSETTVVWNPWAEKVRGMADLGADEWLRFLCVETASVADHAVALGPGGRHELRASIRAEPR